MKLHKLILTENACYKAGRKITVKGIMVHSTGANNPWLKRYIGPDDGQLGQNKYNNHWNTYHPSGREVCVHAFIGKLADGSIATYQTLPWDHRGWHAGGSANNTHIGFEICEDDLTNGAYFKKVYTEAVELCAMLCKQFGLTEADIICHCEGRKLGIASNHGDVMHWFPKFGKSMDTFRADVKALLTVEQKEAPKAEIGNGSVVEFNTNAVRYTPAGKEIPAWVKSDYNHIVTQTTSRGKEVIKDGEKCVLLGKKQSKRGGEIVAGINTWVAKSNLKLVEDRTEITEQQRTYMVQRGDTLWGIAKKALGKGARYTEIVKLNGLKTSTIYAGQVLKIPQK